MANLLQPQDCYAILNDVAKMVTGRTDIAVVDTTSFVTVGDTLLRFNTENTLNAISTVLSKTIFSIRPYKAKLQQLMASNERWGSAVRKIVFLPGDLEESQDWNTQIHADALDDGKSVDMYKIAKPKALQLNFVGTKIIQRHITRFRDQLALAFQNEGEFSQFIEGVMTEFLNDLETVHESETRLTLINYMTAMKAMNLEVVDLADEFNVAYGTDYTRNELLTTYQEDFMKFVVSRINHTSDLMEDRSAKYHFSPTGKTILRFTPKSKQRMIMYGEFFESAKANVLSTIFNPEMLKIGSYEKVNYWQAEKNPSKITAKPNILNAAGESTDASAAVTIDYVLGILYDVEAMGVNFQFDYSSTTPFNSAGGYYNMFIHERKNFWNDFTENAVLFTIGAGGPRP